MRRLPGLSIYLSLLSIFTVPSSHSVQEKKPVAYVITAASNASQKGREPTWIGLMSGSRTLHIPANESIIEVSPGSYRLHHFDFGKSRSSGHGTLHVNSRIKKMKISPSTIYFIGRFEVSKRSNTLIQDPQFIKDACKVSPKVFERLPLRFVFAEGLDNDYKVDCTTEALTPFDE